MSATVLTTIFAIPVLSVLRQYIATEVNAFAIAFPEHINELRYVLSNNVFSQTSSGILWTDFMRVAMDILAAPGGRTFAKAAQVLYEGPWKSKGRLFTVTCIEEEDDFDASMRSILVTAITQRRKESMLNAKESSQMTFLATFLISELRQELGISEEEEVTSAELVKKLLPRMKTVARTLVVGRAEKNIQDAAPTAAPNTATKAKKSTFGSLMRKGLRDGSLEKAVEKMEQDLGGGEEEAKTASSPAGEGDKEVEFTKKTYQKKYGDGEETKEEKTAEMKETEAAEAGMEGKQEEQKDASKKKKASKFSKFGSLMKQGLKDGSLEKAVEKMEQDLGQP